MKTSASVAPPTQGLKLEWKSLPRRRCDNCGKSYQPKQPLRKNPDGTMQHGFHSPECKKQFHKHGSAFIQLRRAMEKEMAAMEKRFREIVREEITAQAEREDRVRARFISLAPGERISSEELTRLVR